MALNIGNFHIGNFYAILLLAKDCYTSYLQPVDHFTKFARYLFVNLTYLISKA